MLQNSCIHFGDSAAKIGGSQTAPGVVEYSKNGVDLMGFSYQPFWQFLKRQGITMTKIREYNIISQQTLQNMKEGKTVSFATLEGVIKRFYPSYKDGDFKILSDFAVYVPDTEWLEGYFLLKAQYVHIEGEYTEEEKQYGVHCLAGKERLLAIDNEAGQAYTDYLEEKGLWGESFYKIADFDIPTLEALVFQIHEWMEGQRSDIDLDSVKPMRKNQIKSQCAQTVQSIQPVKPSNGVSRELKAVLNGIKSADTSTTEGRTELKALIERARNSLDQLESNLTDK